MLVLRRGRPRFSPASSELPGDRASRGRPSGRAARRGAAWSGAAGLDVRVEGLGGDGGARSHGLAQVFPAAPVSVALLLEAGANVNDDSGGDRPETPLHWAASTDDVEVALVFIEGRANLGAPGGSIGTPLDNAIGYGCWHVARLLVARGARVEELWHAAALGMLDRTRALLESTPTPSHDDLNEAFWQACHGGQRRVAELLLSARTDIEAVPRLVLQPVTIATHTSISMKVHFHEGGPFP
jgi:hypothetical protein